MDTFLVFLGSAAGSLFYTVLESLIIKSTSCAKGVKLLGFRSSLSPLAVQVEGLLPEFLLKENSAVAHNEIMSVCLQSTVDFEPGIICYLTFESH